MINVKIRSKGKRKTLSMYYVDPVTKKEVTRSAGTGDLRQAQKNAIRWEDELKKRRGEHDDNWEYVRERFESEHAAGLSPASRGNYKTALDRFRKFWKGEGLAEISPTTISQFKLLLLKKYPATTVTSYLRNIKAFLRWAAKMEIIEQAPAFFMPKRDKTKKLAKGRPLTDKEWSLFLKTCPDEQWVRFLMLLRLGGLRLEEGFICSWDGPQIRVELDATPPRMFFRADSHKARKDMYVPLVPDLYAWLAKVPQKERRGLVCPLTGECKSRMDQPYTEANGVGKVISRIGRETGIVTGRSHTGLTIFASAHDLRRTFGTYWAARVKPLTLQRLMRHADFSTTLAYYVDLSLEDIAKDCWSAVPKIAPSAEKNAELMRWAACDFPEDWEGDDCVTTRSGP